MTFHLQLVHMDMMDIRWSAIRTGGLFMIFNSFLGLCQHDGINSWLLACLLGLVRDSCPVGGLLIAIVHRVAAGQLIRYQLPALAETWEGIRCVAQVLLSLSFPDV